MKCPRTGKPLVPRKIGELQVDVSPACAGVWFDRFELEKVDEPHEALGDLLLEHLSECHQTLLDTAPRLNCPRDNDVVMMRRYFSPKQQIEIDECPACGGIWLDAEELEGIRNLFKGAADRASASKAFSEAIMSSPEVIDHEQDYQRLISKLGGIATTLWRVIGVRK